REVAAAAEPAEQADDSRAVANEKGGLAKGRDELREEHAKKPAAAPAAPAPNAPRQPRGGAGGRDAKDTDKERAGYDEQKDKKADGDRGGEGLADTESSGAASSLSAARKVEEAEDLGRRRNVRELYRMPDPTRRYAENNYWHRKLE